MPDYTSYQLAVLEVIDGEYTHDGYNSVASYFGSTTYGPLTEEETYYNQEKCADFMTEVFFRRWLKAALPDEEFQETVSLTFETLEEKYPEILVDGPRALIWENQLLHIESFLKTANSLNSSKKAEGKAFLKDFISTYYETDRESSLSKEMWNLANKNGRISNYWVDSDSVVSNKKYVLSRVLFNRYWNKKSNQTEAVKLTQAFDNFSRYTLMADLISSYTSGNVYVEAHQNFITKYEMDKPFNG